MKQSPSEVNIPSAIQPPRIAWNASIIYRIHNGQPLVPTLSEINPLHTPTPPYFLKIYFNIERYNRKFRS
jgi:hypothetical protein